MSSDIDQTSRRAVIYLRVSTSKQADKDFDPEGYSLPAQREACQRKAEALDAEVVEEYLDRGESARTADRPNFQAMIERIKTKQDVDYVIVDKLDRFARNRRDDANILFDLRMAGANLVSVKENVDETPAGQLLHAILAGINEFYSRNNGTETIKGMRQKVQVGGTPYRAPLGYLNARKVVTGREIRIITFDQERAPLIRAAFELYATGEWTLQALLDELTARGLRTRPPGERPVKPVTLPVFARILHNPYYMGIVRWNGVEYEGRHDPLIDAETFARVQEIMAAHFLAGDKQRRHNHYLKGSVYCRRCGSRLCLTNAKGRYLYFFCAGRHQRRTDCLAPYMLADDVEDAVERYYTRVQLEPARIEAIRTGLRTRLETSRTAGTRERQRQQRRIDRLLDERTKLLHAHYAEAIPLDLLRDEQARITREITEAKQALAATELEYAQIERNLDTALALASDPQAAYRQARPQIRRRFNQAFFDKLYVDTGEVVGAELASPFAELLASDLVERLSPRETANPEPLLSFGPGFERGLRGAPGETRTHGVGVCGARTPRPIVESGGCPRVKSAAWPRPPHGWTPHGMRRVQDAWPVDGLLWFGLAVEVVTHR